MISGSINDAMTVANIVEFIGNILPFFAVVVLGLIAWKFWMKYIQMNYIAGIEWTTLQVKIPRDVWKTPQAMEFVLLNAFHQTISTATWFNRSWEGKVRAWFALEIVSIEGNIHFFIRTPLFFKNLIESQIYAQYPKAEISEVPDYTEQLVTEWEGAEWDMWGCEYKLNKPDAYPIKTYIDYGLDQAQGLEEEQRIDPMTPMLEYMGAIGPGEQIWFQIIIRAATERYNKPGTWFGKHKWTDEAQLEIKKLMAPYAIKDEQGNKTSDFQKIPKPIQDTISAIDRAADKFGFDVGMRGMYLAKKEKFKGINNVGLMSVIKQYNSQNLNGFKPTHHTSVDYPWQDYKDSRASKFKKELFEAYRLRAFFYPPHDSKIVALKHFTRVPFILNTEELATIFHFPGQVAATPTFGRIESKKAEPPGNLPL